MAAEPLPVATPSIYDRELYVYNSVCLASKYKTKKVKLLVRMSTLNTRITVQYNYKAKNMPLIFYQLIFSIMYVVSRLQIFWSILYTVSLKAWVKMCAQNNALILCVPNMT